MRSVFSLASVAVAKLPALKCQTNGPCHLRFLHFGSGGPTPTPLPACASGLPSTCTRKGWYLPGGAERGPENDSGRSKQEVRSGSKPASVDLGVPFWDYFKGNQKIANYQSLLGGPLAFLWASGKRVRFQSLPDFKHKDYLQPRNLPRAAEPSQTLWL